MPGRVAARAPRATTARTKTRSTTSSNTNSDIVIPDEGEDTSLRTLVCSIFSEVQRSANAHRKLVVSLRKVQEACCYEPTSSTRPVLDNDFDETEFNNEICRCMVRVLPVKKSESIGDRIVKFLGAFLKHASAIDNSIYMDEQAEIEQIIPETPTSRLTTQIFAILIPLLPAKDKIVRFRSTQIIAYLINTLDSIDDELFQHIRLGLLKRSRDRETNVRVQAVYGLGRLAGEVDLEQQDDDDSDDESSGGLLERLLDILQNDPSPEVRRSLLLNLPFTPVTLPFLLERARDLDASIRRVLYARLLPALGDFRHLSLTHREKLLRWGLRDRDENVKKATARLFRERWIEDCVRPPNAEGQAETSDAPAVSPPDLQGLLELLERIDVVNAGIEGGIALDAMMEFWQGRPDYCDHVEFDENYWSHLTPESAFVARTFNDFAQNSSSYDDKMPELTRFAFLLQTNVNELVERVQKSAFDPDCEEEAVHQEFVVEQLLHIAMTLDYSDEVGRRTVFSLMREALAFAELPEESTKLVVEVLRTSCGYGAAGEKEFSDVILEAIAEVHDTILGEDQPTASDQDMDESFHSARSELSGDTTPKNKIIDPEQDAERAVKEIMVNMKCLHIAQCMLQNVECSLERNPALVTMLNNLVVPAVRSQEAPIRERGLLCLGLCCLLDKNLAEENLELFLLCFSKGHEALQSIAIQIVGDILSAHPTILMSASDPAVHAEHPLHKPVHKLFSKSLKSQSALVQSTACTALAKLMLSTPVSRSEGSNSILNHDELLKMLTIAYFDPELADNSSLRQSLSYFLPVYCHSRAENLQRMSRIVLHVLHWCLSTKEELEVEGEDEGNNEMVGTAVVTAHLVDWTDERKLASNVMKQGTYVDDEDTACGVHFEIAEKLLEKIVGVCSKPERKAYISMLGRLHISPIQDGGRLQTVTDLIQESIDERVAEDAASRNTLNKVHVAILKMQVDESRTRGASRARSIAPSVGDDDDDDTKTVNGLEDHQNTTTLTIRDQNTTEMDSEITQLPNEEDLTEYAADTTIQPNEQRPESSSISCSPTKQASRPKWKPEELLVDSSIDDTEMSTVASPQPSPSPSVPESSMIVSTAEEVTPASPLKRRGRPPKPKEVPTPSAVEQATGRGTRRNVRASRRQQKSMAESEDEL